MLGCYMPLAVTLPAAGLNARVLLQGTDVSGSVFSFGDEKLGASSNSDRMPAGGVAFSASAAAAAAGLNALVADEERGLMLEKAFAPSDAGSDGSHRCALLGPVLASESPCRF